MHSSTLPPTVNSADLTGEPATPSLQLFTRKGWTRDVNNTPQYTTAQAWFVGRMSCDGHQVEKYIHGVGLGRTWAGRRHLGGRRTWWELWRFVYLDLPTGPMDTGSVCT